MGEKQNNALTHKVCVMFRICTFSAELFWVISLSLCLLCSWQEYGDFGVALSEVLAVWKYFLLEKLQLSPNDISPPQSYDLIRKEYDCFLKRTNTVDLIDVFVMFKELRMSEDPEEPMTAVSAHGVSNLVCVVVFLKPGTLSKVNSLF